MKKTIIKITATTVCIFLSFAVFAQTELKPKIDESGKPKENDKPSVSTELQIVTAPKVLTVAEQPKPIVAGGNFKPMETGKLVVPADKKVPDADQQKTKAVPKMQ
jgi:hypothetical protein